MSIFMARIHLICQAHLPNMDRADHMTLQGLDLAQTDYWKKVFADWHKQLMLHSSS